MNIFVTSYDPIKSARYLDDQRVVKMITESVQMLCTAVSFISSETHGLYKPTHVGHPCNVWVRERQENFKWTYEHALALQEEWQRRWGHDRQHRAIEMFNDARGWKHFKALKRGSTPFVNCAANASLGISFKHVEDVRKAYRLYLKARWKLQQENHPPKRLAICSVRFS